jgi:hypothetical protein
VTLEKQLAGLFVRFYVTADIIGILQAISRQSPGNLQISGYLQAISRQPPDFWIPPGNL